MRARTRTQSLIALALVLVACGPSAGADAGLNDAGRSDGDAGEDEDGGVAVPDARTRTDSGPPCPLEPFYRDADGDGFGDGASSTLACVAPEGFVANVDDCDDRCADCHPGAAELCGSARDEDCDGATDEATCETCTTSCAWSCAAGTCNDAANVSAGGFHACALRESGAVVCWGEGERLGSGSRSDSTVPVAVTRIPSAASISAGWSHSCARNADGTLACWGSNSTGALGLGRDDTTYVALSPVLVPGLAGVRDATVGGGAGGSFTCAATPDRVVCFGYNSHGQLGDGSRSLSRTPVAVEELAAPVARIAAGGEHACALLDDGRMQCWGANAEGQLGIGTNEDSLVAAAPISGLTATQVALGDAHTCAVDGDGAVWCWGANEYGQLGRLGSGSSVPVRVDGLTATALSAGGDTTCAVDTAGQAWCWGANGRGQVGDGTTENRFAPTAVGGVSNALSVTVGSSFVCALGVDRAVACWGEGRSGQLGNGALALSTVPVVVSRP